MEKSSKKWRFLPLSGLMDSAGSRRNLYNGYRFLPGTEIRNDPGETSFPLAGQLVA